MRIGILTSYFFHKVKEIHGEDRIIFGGAERYLVELVNHLRSEGHEVMVFQPIEGGQTVTKQYAGIPIVCLPVKEADWQLSTNSHLNMAFNEVAASFDLRIYFATFLCWPHVVRPAVAISHGIFWDYPHHFMNTARPQDREEFMRRQLYGFTAPDVCVAVDQNVKRTIAAIAPGGESKIFVIPNFVNTEQFTPAPQRDWEPLRVLYPRRLTMLRGCNEFIYAAQRLGKYEFLICGNATDAATEKKLDTWTSNIPNLRAIWREMEQMPEVYQTADIAVIPTRAAEGLSLALLEAMACGLPIVATAVGGLGDALIDGYNALIFDQHYDDLADYVELLAEDESLRSLMRGRNLEIAKCFDLKVWQTNWKRMLNTI